MAEQTTLRGNRLIADLCGTAAAVAFVSAFVWLFGGVTGGAPYAAVSFVISVIMILTAGGFRSRAEDDERSRTEKAKDDVERRDIDERQRRVELRASLQLRVVIISHERVMLLEERKAAAALLAAVRTLIDSMAHDAYLEMSGRELLKLLDRRVGRGIVDTNIDALVDVLGTETLAPSDSAAPTLATAPA